MKVFLSPLATLKLDLLLEYLETNWGQASKFKFLIKFKNQLNTISSHPKSSKQSETFTDIYVCVITKHTSFLYQILEDKKEIEIITVFDNRQDPEKLAIEIKKHFLWIMVSKGNLLKYIEGDNEALSISFETTLPNLIFYAYRFVHDKEVASDLVVDLFERLIQYSTTERKEKLTANPDHFKNLVYLIVKNKCLDYIKVNSNRERILSESISKPFLTENTAEELFIKESFDSLCKCLGERQKEVLTLSINGYTPDEIAKSLNLSVQTVKNTLSTTRRKVKVLWNDFFEG